MLVAKLFFEGKIIIRLSIKDFQLLLRLFVFLLCIDFLSACGAGGAAAAGGAFDSSSSGTPPVINSSSSWTIAENTITVTTISVSDSDTASNQLELSMTGVDQGAFTLDTNGRLRFSSNPDFESPKDAGGKEFGASGRIP